MEEVDLGFSFAPSGGEKNAGLATGDEGDVGGKAGAAACFLQDCGWGGGVAGLNPSHADAGRIAGVTEALNRFELGWTKRDRKSRGGLRGRARNVQQVLQQFGHIGTSRIDAAAGAGGERVGAGAFISG